MSPIFRFLDSLDSMDWEGSNPRYWGDGEANGNGDPSGHGMGGGENHLEEFIHGEGDGDGVFMGASEKDGSGVSIDWNPEAIGGGEGRGFGDPFGWGGVYDPNF